MKLKKILFALLAVLYLSSCTEDSDSSFDNVLNKSKDNIELTPEEVFNMMTNYKERKLMPNTSISKAEIELLDKAGLSGGRVRKYLSVERGKKSYFEYEIDGDSYVTQDQLKRWSQENREKQFRTQGALWPHENRVLNVFGVGLDPFPNIRQGLIDAIENYNDLHNSTTLSLEFTLQFVANPNQVPVNDNTIAVVVNPNGQLGGQAGFPSGGDPFNLVTIFSGTDALGLNTCLWVATHEIAHCIGYRHTDYFDRSISCGGDPIDEGHGGVGARWLPGTPSWGNIDMNSVFLSCFDGTETGELSLIDIQALRCLYCHPSAIFCGHWWCG